MSNERTGFPWMFLVVLVIGLLIVAFFTFPILGIFPGIFLSVQQIKRHEAKMQNPNIYDQVGHSLAVYCQTGPAIFPTGFVGHAWLPKVVRDLNPSESLITETNAHIMMGGGFHHYGYSLQRQPSSSVTSNVWALTFYSEGADPKVISTFSTACSETVPVARFVADALAEYDLLSKSKQDEIYALWAQEHRIAFLLQFDSTKVREGCLKAIQDLPNHWWPRLTLAFVDSAKGHEAQAAGELTRWVEAKPSYSRYLILAYYFEEMKKSEQATAAIEMAIKCPIIDLPDDMNNTECRGYSAGVYAFQAAQYATVIRLCDVLLPVKENGNYAKAALSDLRRSAVTAQSGTAPAFEPDERILRFNPYEYVSLNALRSF